MSRYADITDTGPTARFPARDEIGPDEPLRLADALRIAFPHGGMTLAGLRREIGRQRLTVEKIAGKHYTTLNNIDEMRRL